MEHPTRSPDLAPFDSHLFGMLKEALRGRRFRFDEGVKNIAHQCLRALP
jgi:hypothetical protein